MWCGGMRALVLNSQLMNDAVNAEKEALAQEAWLSDELEAFDQQRGERGRHLVVFQHIPWLLRGQAESVRSYYEMKPSVREKWLPRLKRHGVSKVFCGHFHRNNTSFSEDGELEVVVTSAVGKQLSAEEVVTNRPVEGASSDIASGFRLVSVGAHNISHEYIEF